MFLFSILLFALILFFFLVYLPVSFLLLVIFTWFGFKKKKFHILRKLLIIDGAIFLLTICLIATILYLSRPPATQKLSNNYFQNKDRFNILVGRILTDQKKGLVRVDDNWTEPDNLRQIGLNSSDIDSYREELIRLSIPRGFYAYPNEVRFIAYAYGLSVSGRSKGYLYSISKPKNFFKRNCGYPSEPLKSLDHFKGCEGGSGSYTIYQQIDKNWYIYEDYED